MDLSGRVLGQYQLIELAGEGGMAAVYKAYQPGLDRFVAVKVLPPQLARAELRERFIREAKAIAQLSHPNILPIYDTGVEGDLSYFVMKYVASRQTLRDLLCAPLTLPHISRYIDQMAAALDHAHAHNIVHRDVKPNNILVEDNWLLLADFGLAKTSLEGESHTRTGTVLGTPDYLSPEQAAGRPSDYRADIYSLGVILYEMVLGHVPFQAETVWGILYKHIHDPVPRPRRFNPDLPQAVENIIIRALDKNPANRFNRAGDMAEALRAQVQHATPYVLTSPPLPTTKVFSEDGEQISNEDSLPPPKPQFDPHLLEILDAPGGVIKLRDKFYIERQGDDLLKREIIKTGTTTTIRASRQTGKSSLLVRGINYAREQTQARIVHLDLQRLEGERLASPDVFLRDLAEFMVRKLRLDMAEVDLAWRGSLGPQDKLTYLMEDYILPQLDTPLVLALDEVDRLLQTPFYTNFFALLRAWHNSRALSEEWDKLNMVLVISTEPYMLIADVNQSPFNVGLRIYLEDFNEAQVRDLNRRHGAPVSDADFPQLLSLLGGQPYLTRQALYTLAIKQLAWADLTYEATLDNGPFGDHLRRQQWLLHDEPALKAAFKQIIEQNHCADPSAQFRLLQAGLIKASGDMCACRCDLYRLYFKDKL